MGRFVWVVAAGLAVIAPAPAAEPGSGSFGTSVEFLSTPTEAATAARKDQKLVFILHVSGNFETADFT